MKYWRGYLVAAIAAACSWGLISFSKGHGILVDMIYPYATRMIQTYLSGWNAEVSFCVWQVLLVALIVLVLASVVLMLVFRWNPIQWFGWVCAVVSVLFLLHTGIYGLNDYAGPLSDDIRLEMTEYSLTELETTAVFFRDRAAALSSQIARDADGNVQAEGLDSLSQKASAGYRVLTYQQSMPVFAGSYEPVKELPWAKKFTRRGLTGITVPLTGEAAVNPQTPGVLLPFAVCHEMAHRMSISLDRDANFSAFLACNASDSPEFQYAANLMAYRYCRNALATLDDGGAAYSLMQVESGVYGAMQQDLETVDKFLKPSQDPSVDTEACNMLVSWHIQYFVLPTQVVEESQFDPQDETQVDLTGIVNARPAQ